MITLIFCGDLRYCPYLNRYIERLEKLKCDYEVLFWNRAGAKLDNKKNFYCYNSPSSESLSMAHKAIDFIKFGFWINNHLNSHKTNGLILLSTLTGILLFPKLGKFTNKYIFDIRDYSYENIKLFKRVEAQVIKNSYFTCISSKGFRAFLPKSEYVICHNFNRNEIPEKKEEKSIKEQYDIVWNGTIRFFEYQRKFLDTFKGDSRFRLVYHGTGTDLEKYKRYCEENKIKNVLFTGAYDNKDKADLLKNADVLNNCYGGRSGDDIKYAVSNRFYDGLIFHIPQIVECDGYKADITKKNGIGLVVDNIEGLPDILFNYLKSLNRETFKTKCDTLLNVVIEEDNNYISKIDEFIKSR